MINLMILNPKFSLAASFQMISVSILPISPLISGLQLRGHVPLRAPQGGRAGAEEGRDVPGAGALPGRLVQGHLHAHGQDRSLPRQLHEPHQQVGGSMPECHHRAAHGSSFSI